MLGVLLAAVLTAGGYDGGRQLCTLADPAITESSGLAASSTEDDLLFTHNDSGDTARFFEIDRTCRTRATFVLAGVQARDWEDISRGPGHTLWLADIGDNSGIRDRGVLVHRVTEPGPATGTHTVRATSYRLRYEDGPHDAEALLVHPRTGQLLVVTKGFGGGTVYAAAAPLRADSPNTLRRVGQVAVPEVTAGDISPDGTHVVLRNYAAAYEWAVEGDDVAAALTQRPTRIPLPEAAQGEGITYSRDGQRLLVSSEGAGAPLQELVRSVGAIPAPAVPRAAPDRHSGAPFAATAGLAVALLGGFVLWRRRKSGKARQAANSDG